MNRRFKALSLMIVFSTLTSFSARAEDQPKNDPYPTLEAVGGAATVLSLYAWGRTARDRMEMEAAYTDITNSHLGSNNTTTEINRYVDQRTAQTNGLRAELKVSAPTQFLVHAEDSRNSWLTTLSGAEVKALASEAGIKIKFVKVANKDLLAAMEKAIDRKYTTGMVLKFPAALSVIATAGVVYKSHTSQEVPPSAASDRSAPTRASVIAESQRDVPVAPQTGGGGLR